MAQIGLLVTELKRYLKAHGITYAALAKQLDLSESSVKRQFARQSFSLQRLEQTIRRASGVKRDEQRVGGHAWTSRGESSRPVPSAAGCDPNHLERTYGTDASLSTSPTATRQQRDRS